MDKEVLTALSAEAALHAWEQLIRLNFDSWKPDVAEWLHSADAQPVLKDLLIAVPCSETLH